jgi:hypothetical protein
MSQKYDNSEERAQRLVLSHTIPYGIRVLDSYFNTLYHNEILKDVGNLQNQGLKFVSKNSHLSLRHTYAIVKDIKKMVEYYGMPSNKVVVTFQGTHNNYSSDNINYVLKQLKENEAAKGTCYWGGKKEYPIRIDINTDYWDSNIKQLYPTKYYFEKFKLNILNLTKLRDVTFHEFVHGYSHQFNYDVLNGAKEKLFYQLFPRDTYNYFAKNSLDRFAVKLFNQSSELNKLLETQNVGFLNYDVIKLDFPTKYSRKNIIENLAENGAKLFTNGSNDTNRYTQNMVQKYTKIQEFKKIPASKIPSIHLATKGSLYGLTGLSALYLIESIANNVRRGNVGTAGVNMGELATIFAATGPWALLGAGFSIAGAKSESDDIKKYLKSKIFAEQRHKLQFMQDQIVLDSYGNAEKYSLLFSKDGATGNLKISDLRQQKEFVSEIAFTDFAQCIKEGKEYTYLLNRQIIETDLSHFDLIKEALQSSKNPLDENSKPSAKFLPAILSKLTKKYNVMHPLESDHLYELFTEEKREKVEVYDNKVTKSTQYNSQQLEHMFKNIQQK